MRVLILDDHPLIRKAIRQVVADGCPSWTITEGATGEEALRLLHKEPADIAILDIALPGESGLTVLKRIRQFSPQTKCLVLSIHTEPHYVRLALELGASGYLSKESAPDELEQALKTLSKRGRYLAKSLQESVDGFTSAPRSRSSRGALLSARELEVLCILAKGGTVSRAAKHLKLSVKTVSTYRLRLLDKLDLQTTADLIRYAVDHDLVR